MLENKMLKKICGPQNDEVKRNFGYYIKMNFVSFTSRKILLR